MKKHFFLLAMLCLSLFAACDKESYYHTMSVIKPLQVGVVMADQEFDTLSFYTTDNFALTSSASWAVIPDSMKEGRIRNYYHNIWTVGSPVVFEANTTGTPRLASISIRCFGDDGWDQTGTVTFYQLSWLDISRPLPKYSYKDAVVTGVAFEAEDSATQVTDTLLFYVYNDWTLTDGTFVHPKEMSGKSGSNKIAVDVEPNLNPTPRETTIQLTSRGVTSSIKFTQAAKKEE